MTQIKMPKSITGDYEFPEILGDVVELQFNEVNFINSAGVRKLIQLLKKNSSLSFSYSHCPKVIVDQFNMIDGLIPKGTRIQSFYAPYYCPVTQEEMVVLIESKNVKDQKAPAMKHPTMEHYLEFDDVEAVYFNFLG